MLKSPLKQMNKSLLPHRAGRQGRGPARRRVRGGRCAQHLRARGLTVLLDEARRSTGCRTAAARVRSPELGGEADLIVAIGGDGTLLYAARLAPGTACRCSASIADGWAS